MEAFWGLLDQYGLWALAFGAFFQGYSMVILAGLLVSQDILDLTEVWLVSTISAWVGHWFLYGVGMILDRYRGIIKSPKINKKLDHLENTIKLHPWLSMFFIQYGYGIRIIGAIAFGISRVHRLWFAWAQLINCAIWATLLSGIGYIAGSGVHQLPEHALVRVSILLTMAFVLFAISRRRRRVFK